MLTHTADQLRRAAEVHFGELKGAGRAAAIHRRATRDGHFGPRALGLGATADARWRALARLRLPEPVDETQAACSTGTVTKRLLRLEDGLTVESVHLPMGRGRSSLCISTQAGCARACTFCETGRLGLRRNLTAGEIVGQVTVQHRRQRPDTIVFQGMGEPLDNQEHLLQALAVLTDRVGLGYAHDRLTVCTVGHVPGIAALRQLGWKRLNLSLSLNAADDRQRAAIMPHSQRFPLAEIQRALIAYRQRANLTFGIHWCLLPGINDTPADADRIAAFCAPLGRVLVHVIPYNPGTAPITLAPDEPQIVRFVGWLRERGVPVRRRITKGRSVMAGCGQLGAPTAAPTGAATSS